MKHGMRIVVLVCTVFVGSLPEVVAAASQAAPASRRISVERRPEFRCVAALLQKIVDDAGSHGPQSLHIGPTEHTGIATFVRVYWPEARAILLIDWPTSCSDEDMRIDDAALGWYRTKARIDLDTDVVPTPDDIGGSTYLVDRPWVERVIGACKQGYRLMIEPSARHRKP
jgi:hypothetical protein